METPYPRSYGKVTGRETTTKMEKNAFAQRLLSYHEGVGKKRLFELLVDSISDDEEICQAHMQINGDEDFRLEVEESPDGEGRIISVTVNRIFSGEHVSFSITAEADYEERDGSYYHAGEDFPKMAIADVYANVMDMIRRVEKLRLE